LPKNALCSGTQQAPVLGDPGWVVFAAQGKQDVAALVLQLYSPIVEFVYFALQSCFVHCVSLAFGAFFPTSFGVVVEVGAEDALELLDSLFK
jgi:hypothetical protein